MYDRSRAPLANGRSRRDAGPLLATSLRTLSRPLPAASVPKYSRDSRMSRNQLRVSLTMAVPNVIARSFR
jgi:hypothetical protein